MEENCEFVNNKTPMEKFYSKKCIFITGATGFIGKVLIERLLALYPDIEAIFLLIRSKKGVNIEKRLEAVLNCPIFAKLGNNWQKKIIPIEGELGEVDMSMKRDDRLRLIDRVNIVFHCAATVRFDEKLKTAIKINVIGTRNITALCDEMKDIEALVHVSTAFSNCDKSMHIEEKKYKPGMSPEEATNFLKLDATTLDIMTPRLLKNYANTYAYTKSAAESILLNEGKNLPAVLFRPGIVIGASDKYPYAGFADNLYGPSALVLGVGMGVIRTLHINGKFPSHLVPIDYCINVMLAAAWDVAQNKYDSPPIYNYIPPLSNDIDWKHFIEYCVELGVNLPASDGIWWPAVTVTKYKYFYMILFALTQVLPAIIVDNLLKLTGKKPILLGVQRKVAKSLKVLEYYLVRDWTFQVDGVVALQSRLSAKDRETIYMDMRNFEWKTFLCSFLYGLGVYLKKENPENLDKSVKRLQRLKYIHYATSIVFTAIAVYFIWSWIK